MTDLHSFQLGNKVKMSERKISIGLTLKFHLVNTGKIRKR